MHEDFKDPKNNSVLNIEDPIEYSLEDLNARKHGKGVQSCIPLFFQSFEEKYLNNPAMQKYTNNTKSEIIKEEKMHEHIILPNSFTMAPTEYEKAKNWMEQHGEKHPVGGGTVFGQYWVKFSKNSIGDVTIIGCDVCNEKIDVTDINLW